MDFLRMAVVYVHLIACCVAIGLVLTSDIAMVKDLFNSNPATHDQDHLPKLQRIVSMALVALWITGFSIIGLDLSVKGFEYLTNPKLQAKVAVVALLTFNGYILHKAVLPGLQKAGTLLDLSFKPRMIAIFTGGVWRLVVLCGLARRGQAVELEILFRGNTRRVSRGHPAWFPDDGGAGGICQGAAPVR